MTGPTRISPNSVPHSHPARGRLIASWQPGQSPEADLPASIRWINGDPASPRTWVLTGCWRTTSLQVSDPNVDDFALSLMASTLPIKFKVKIHRDA